MSEEQWGGPLLYMLEHALSKSGRNTNNPYRSDLSIRGPTSKIC
jgi:hypothetical protein